MAKTYTKIYPHIVFAVKQRALMIGKNHHEELQKYLTGIASGLGQKLITIYCMPDVAPNGADGGFSAKRDWQSGAGKAFVLLSALAFHLVSAEACHLVSAERHFARCEGFCCF